MSRPLILSSLLALVAGPASADWYNVPSPGNVPAVPNPTCVQGCGEPSDSDSSSSSGQRGEDPEERAQRQAAAEAAAEAANREAIRQAREALQESEASADAQERLANTGAAIRDRARRFEEYSEDLVRREEKAGRIEGLLGVDRPDRPGAAPPPGPPPAPLSIKEYCQRLNAMAAPGRGLHPSTVPPLSKAALEQTAEFSAPPRIAPDRLEPLLDLASRALEAAKGRARGKAEEAGWELVGRHVPFLRPLHDAFAEGKELYEKLTTLTTRLADQAFGNANEVANTVGGRGGAATDEGNTRVLGSMGNDVDDTAEAQLAKRAPSPAWDFLKKGREWRSP